MVRRIWVKLWRLLWRAVVPSGVYFAFSRFLWRVLPSEKKRLPLDKRLPYSDAAPNTLEGVVRLLSNLQYKRDPFFGLFDYFHHPEATWLKVLRGRPGIGDCDDWAAFVAALLGRLPESELTEICILNVFWVGSRWKPAGHNVCLYRRDGEYFHISNWQQYYGGQVKRGRPWGPYATIDEAVKSIASRGDLAGWCTVTPDLERIVAHS